jgi:hypothetical protein
MQIWYLYEGEVASKTAYLVPMIVHHWAGNHLASPAMYPKHLRQRFHENKQHILLECNDIPLGRILTCVVIGLRGSVRDVDCDERVSEARLDALFVRVWLSILYD